MTIHQAYQQLTHPLYTIYDLREAKQIAHLVLEHITGYTKSERLIHHQELLTNDQELVYHQMTIDLLNHKPVQYVFSEAWFCGLSLYVDESVLIPRPETEELVELVIANLSVAAAQHISILDIGTGSGCIALALKNKLPKAKITATDISDAALNTAKTNAQKHNLSIQFIKHDILTNHLLMDEAFDCIVSNPPYISLQEKSEMQAHVVDYEPHIALFVQDRDSLLFYRKIFDFSIKNLKTQGYIFLEINEQFGSEMLQLASQYSFQDIELKQDLFGKNRFVVIRK